MHLKKRSIANTGVEVTPVGFGTVKIGRNQGVKYPECFSIPSDRQVVDLLNLAQEFGINLLDTAPAYGSSEERLGKLVGNRQDWVIATKVGEEFENGNSIYDFSAQHTQYSVERSLRRLQTDYLDIVLVHSDGNDVDIINNTACLETLSKLKEKGLIRAYGMSTKTVEGGLLAAQLSDLVMVCYNLQQREEEPVIDYAQEENKGIFIKKALASGNFRSENSNQDDPVKENLRFIRQHSGVTSIILGTINSKHLKHNIKCAGI